MLNIVLFEPEIPPNTGNIIRLCANSGCQLHLIKPLGFEFDDKRLRRAGLDYHEWAKVRLYECLDDYYQSHPQSKTYALTTKASQCFSAVEFNEGDTVVFGPETRGLPDFERARIPRQQQLRIPMLENSRSLNLSNSVAVVVYEAWRQKGFPGSL